jgi:hypothetical protein
MAVDDPGQGVGQVSKRIDVVQLKVSTREAMTAQCSAPPSEPANSAYSELDLGSFRPMLGEVELDLRRNYIRCNGVAVASAARFGRNYDQKTAFNFLRRGTVVPRCSAVVCDRLQRWFAQQFHRSWHM